MFLRVLYILLSMPQNPTLMKYQGPCIIHGRGLAVLTDLSPVPAVLDLRQLDLCPPGAGASHKPQVLQERCLTRKGLILWHITLQLLLQS